MITPEDRQFDPTLLTLVKKGTYAYGFSLLLRQVIKNVNTNDTHVAVTATKVLLGGGPTVAKVMITAIKDGCSRPMTFTIDYQKHFEKCAGSALANPTPTQIAEWAKGQVFQDFKRRLDDFFRQQEQEETRETA